MLKKVIISGVNGQDGAYLAEKLLNKKKYKIYGILRRGSTKTIERLVELGIDRKIHFLRCDITEHQTVQKFIENIKPDYFYNLAAQSFVEYSFENPFNTFDVNSNAVLNILETLRRNKFFNCRFYQASTSEMFGNTVKKKNQIIDIQNNFDPVSPYAISKLSAHHLVKIYRESFNLFACSGVLFNHESPLRGDEFVTQKIIKNLINQKYKQGPILELGNIDSKRDWGHAKDYVEAMIKINEYKKPKDYIIATGKSHSVREFLIKSATKIGFVPKFSGYGINEICKDEISGKILMKKNKKYFRQNELHYLKGNSSKAKKELKWKPRYTLDKLIDEMINFELEKLKD